MIMPPTAQSVLAEDLAQVAIGNTEITTIETITKEINNILASESELPAGLQNNITTALSYIATLREYILAQNAVKAASPVVTNTPDSNLTPPESPPSNLLWSAIVGMYGVLRPGISLMKLEQEDGTDVTGTISYDPTDDRFLLFDIDEDTIPPNTLGPVLAVIDPLRSGPGDGLDSALTGQRYLFTEATGSYSGTTPTAWEGVSGQPLVANANDIVEFDGNQWVVAFDSTSSPHNIQYVTNITTSIQYKWVGNTWVKSYQGLYPGGTWALVL
jgi:hypothetical protein